MSKTVTFLRSDCGAAAAEFALVLPIAIMLMFGLIDVGRLMYILNRAEKATQIGVRMAVVTDPVSVGLINEDYADSSLAAGELIPADRLGRFVCTNTQCSCETPACPADATVDGKAFGNIAGRMDDIVTRIGIANVRIAYSGSGFGYAGDPAGGGGGGGAPAEQMEITPLVTVSLTNLRFRSFFLLGLVNFTLPPFSSSLPAEDSSGQYAS